MSKATEIPDEMWEHHKPKILELYRGKRTVGGLPTIAKLMEENNSFKATYVSPQPSLAGPD
jgi:hypothetical protein